MSTILLSIKPEYSSRIFKGTKKYEFRKHLAKKNVNKIIVYSSYPEQRIIGEVEVIDILSLKPTPLWEATKNEAGISRAKFRAYFKGCENAYAYKLGKFKKYDTPKTLIEFGIKHPPQSFLYIDEK
ncbi:MAG: ASCH domain-containing protein [Ruminococcus sp.]|jgi:predicted transcriptional regulator|uniref:ASCH domain-containing protein n=1 Tax=Ruminococcus sp. TaxID=41978 RepID=UPI0025E54BD3|nr:ASCH domain-containing protein [Ruminococcus sp.]MBD9047440.1 ASCH domain-containing protein [Ruminococcus sp.]